jgi:hypothetical protein
MVKRYVLKEKDRNGVYKKVNIESLKYICDCVSCGSQKGGNCGSCGFQRGGNCGSCGFLKGGNCGSCGFQRGGKYSYQTGGDCGCNVREY